VLLFLPLSRDRGWEAVQLQVRGRRPAFRPVHPSVRGLRFQAVGGEADDHVPHRPLGGQPGLENEGSLQTRRAQAGKSARDSAPGPPTETRRAWYVGTHPVGP